MVSRALIILFLSIISTFADSGSIGYDKTSKAVAPTNLVITAASVTAKVTNSQLYSVTGILKGDGAGGTIPAIPNTDYAVPGGATIVSVNGASVTTPNFTNTSTATLSVTGTNISVNPTNIGNAQLSSGIDAAKIADGSVSSIEFQRLDGVTGAIQTQIDSKAPIANPTFTGTATAPSVAIATETVGSVTITNSAKLLNTTASRAAVIGADQTVTNSVTTDTELGYLSGVTSSIQTQVNGKAGTANNLSFFAATTSAQLFGVLSDETGSASGTPLAVFNQSPVIVTPTIASFANATHNHQAAAGGGTLAEAALALTDVTTANASTSGHGFVPKLPNDATKFYDGTGAYSVPAYPSAANPSGTVGLSTVNGSASTFMRSDGTPSLSQGIVPTWTGAHTFNASSGVPVTIQPVADTTAMTVKGVSITGSGATTGLDLSGTFNTSGAPDFLKITVTNTASSASANTIHIKGGASGTSDLMTLDASQGNLTVRANISSTFGQLSGTSVALVNNGTLIASGDGAWQVKNSGSSGFTSLQFGPDVASSPANPILKAAGGLGTDKAGGNLIKQGGASTGTGRGGALMGQTTPSSTTGSSANAYSERYHYIAKAVTLTESSATTVATIACASGKFVGGQCVVTINADDATDFQARTLRFTFSAINKGGTVTAGIDTPSEAVAVSTGTLTATITAVANGNAVDLKVNAVSSLTQTTLNATVALPTLNGNSTATVTEI